MSAVQPETTPDMQNFPGALVAAVQMCTASDQKVSEWKFHNIVFPLPSKHKFVNSSDVSNTSICYTTHADKMSVLNWCRCNSLFPSLEIRIWKYKRCRWHLDQKRVHAAFPSCLFQSMTTLCLSNRGQCHRRHFNLLSIWLRGTYIFKCSVDCLCHAFDVLMAVFLGMFWGKMKSIFKSVIHL